MLWSDQFRKAKQKKIDVDLAQNHLKEFYIAFDLGSMISVKFCDFPLKRKKISVFLCRAASVVCFLF